MTPRLSSTIGTAATTVFICVFVLFLQTARVDSQQHVRPQQFAIEPTARTAIVGDTVVLACRVTDKAGALQWTKDGFGLGTNRNLSGFPRYQMVGSDDEGDYSLHISPVALEDDAMYQCQVGAYDGVKGIRSRTAHFTVYAPPKPPKILRGTDITLRAGETVSLTCESLDGKPAAELAWLDGDNNVVSNGLEYKKSPSKNNKRENAELTWTFEATKELNGQRLTCRAENPALKQPLITAINVRVQYAPEITLTVNKDEIHEQDSVELRCKTSAFPEPLSIHWYRNDEPIKADDGQDVLELTKVSRKANGDMISCEVRNAVGVNRSTVALNVIYKPQFKTSDKPVMAVLGTEVAISCDVDSNPKPEVVWTRQGSNVVLGRQQVYVIREMTPSDVGTYTCRATVPKFPDITNDYHVYIKGAPRIISPPLQYASEGAEARVECLVQAVPPATRVQWFKDGVLIDTDKIQGYHIAREPLPSGERNLLVIERATASDFGEYNCTVQNTFGEHSATISVECDRRAATTLLMLGATAAAIFIVLFAVTMTICLRKKPPPQDFKETPGKPLSTGGLVSDKDNNSSGGESDMKVEIRTASSLSNNENNSPQHTPLTAMDSSWDSGVPPDASTLPPYKAFNDYTCSSYQAQTNILSNKPPEPPQQQNNGGYGGGSSGCVASSGIGGGVGLGITGSGGPCAMSDYMTANSDYGVMLPLQSLPPLSPQTSPVHTVHPLTVLNGGLRISPQHLANVSPHQQHRPNGQQQQQQQQHHRQHQQPPSSQQLPLAHHLPVMTNNSLYATGAFSAALILPQYPLQPNPNQASLSLSECGSLPRPCSQLRMATAHAGNPATPATAYISSTLPYNRVGKGSQQQHPPPSQQLQQLQQAEGQQSNPSLSPVAQRRYITATAGGRGSVGSQFKSAQLATHV
ncbi:irregular chiasm C-roughest protein-like isoform X2 [Varroa jacobsoni]|uniref:irregular chiasm C-roughest protein-like isoform X2 n=1 Tax=Varroa jacobsoni TaxID=62625 RepID=UPI000BF82E87|nr:irregular chiasm C-roughest protein-like isoform X2 [Varroa jacobsoni]